MAVSDFKILDGLLFQILEIWYPILFCSYLGSLISYRNVFVLQTEQWIPPFKLNMSQPSSMFVVGDIIQTILDAFFWDTLYLILNIWYSLSDTQYTILFIWYSLSDTQYLVLNILYLMAATQYLLLRNFNTCYLLLNVWYLLVHVIRFCFFNTGYLNLTISSKKIDSFRSCSVTSSCYFSNINFMGIWDVIINWLNCRQKHVFYV